MSRQNIAKVSIECELGAENRFRFVGTLVGGSSQVLATGVGGQHVELFRALLQKLALVYSVDNQMAVETDNSRIIGVP